MTESEKQELRVKVHILRGLCPHTEKEYYCVEDGNSVDSGFTCKSCGKDPHREGKVPDYPNDLNACAEFEKGLTFYQGVVYRQRLTENSDGPDALFPTAEAAMCHATATQRCLAFVKIAEQKDKVK